MTLLYLARKITSNALKVEGVKKLKIVWRTQDDVAYSLGLKVCLV